MFGFTTRQVERRLAAAKLARSQDLMRLARRQAAKGHSTYATQLEGVARRYREEVLGCAA